MFDRSRRITAFLAMGLGALHLAYGIFVFRALTVDHIWFAGAGFAMILAGHANLDKARLLPSILMFCLLYTSPSPRDLSTSRMPSSA